MAYPGLQGSLTAGEGYSGAVPEEAVDIKTDEQWRACLSPDQYQVLRHAATEPPWSGEYVRNHEDGSYRCAGCGAVLFDSDAKFDSGTGWPSFYEPAVAKAVELRTDKSHRMVRTEVVCRGVWRPPGPCVR